MKEENRGLHSPEYERGFKKIFQALSGSDAEAISLIKEIEREGQEIFLEVLDVERTLFASEYMKNPEVFARRFLAYKYAMAMVKYNFINFFPEELLNLQNDGVDVARVITTVDRVASLAFLHQVQDHDEYFQACECVEGSTFTSLQDMLNSDVPKVSARDPDSSLN